MIFVSEKTFKKYMDEKIYDEMRHRAYEIFRDKLDGWIRQYIDEDLINAPWFAKTIIKIINEYQLNGNKIK